MAAEQAEDDHKTSELKQNSNEFSEIQKSWEQYRILKWSDRIANKLITQW